MLSILIPIYNEDVTGLVKEVYRQCCLIDEFDFEIRVYDDQSISKYKDINISVSYLHNVYYKELPSNVGRSKIRNLLAFDAKGDKLLFLDGDSGIIKKDFIYTYLSSKGDIIYGGRIYNPTIPQKDYILHWKYGIQIESQNETVRSKTPVTSFMSNNFMISKSVFYNNLFDESIKGYGYEDIEFAERLKKKNIEITHINNPVIHFKLDNNEDFLDKTENAIKNLHYLINSERISETKLTRFHNKYALLVRIFGHKKMGLLLRKHLLGSNPNLKLLQLYKLIIYDRLS